MSDFKMQLCSSYFLTLFQYIPRGNNTIVAQYIRGDTIAIPMYLFLKKKENYSINRLTESIASTQFHR